ncbi:hypothetical protein KIH74_16325 [Kineosporia sp. J2-2]|uniref:VWFA domain-containing protein n=1 Tax=Kineosporia corallincola TaxID=2835133 RepID=A0ABS5THE6_9ACTN|nr:hypothetical protein [Kineosporia corallincola]MBT0770512.1 hypothetical protein [Kineosporia corallincola]
MSPRRRDPRYRYGPWRGGPDPLAPPYDVRRALDALGDRVLSGDNVREALRDLLRRGLPDENGRRTGLDDLRARAERRRRETSRRGRLDGAVTRARAQLDQALAAEREELSLRDGDDARFAETQLDALPRSTAAAVQELSEYRWSSREAEQIYRQILDGLRTDVIDQQFNGMRNALQGLGPDADPQQRAAATAAVNEMLDDLNGLLEKHSRGEDTPEDFQRFMDRHGRMFPDDPQNVEELIDSLARQAAAAERLMNALSPQQREELQGLMQQALGDSGLASKMGQLTDNLRALRPGEGWGSGRGEGRRMRGQGEMGYGEAAGALQDLADLDDLIDQLDQGHPGATLDDIDVETVERSLGAGAAADVRALQELERELERQGWLTRADGALTLSPKALRRLGQTALRQVFAHLGSGRRGEHDLRDAGAAGEATGASRRWEFGDEQPLDVVRSLRNAVQRSAGSGQSGITLLAEDFEVVETERRASAAVALCVDLSYSMISEGRWGPMKETALALAHLVATRFPQDALQIVGFGRYASRLSVEQLAAIEPDYVQGTNLQHALSIAGRHLRRHPDAEPVVLVVTDGEPTAHLTPDGSAFFDYPPSPATISATVTEVDALTRYGAAINMFMLGENAGLRRFVDAIARRNGGRVFTPGLDNLGEYVVSDYLTARKGRR